MMHDYKRMQWLFTGRIKVVPDHVCNKREIEETKPSSTCGQIEDDTVQRG